VGKLDVEEEIDDRGADEEGKGNGKTLYEVVRRCLLANPTPLQNKCGTTHYIQRET